MAGAGLRGAIDRAISIGTIMGEERDLVGMGIVAGTAIARTDNATANYNRTGTMAGSFSAPHTPAAMASMVTGGPALPDTGLARQYSATLDTRDTQHAFDAFEAGVKAELGMGGPNALGAYAERHEMATVAYDVATKAADLGIDLSYGATHYGSGWQAGQKAGVGANPAQYKDHYVGPFAKGTAPKQADLAARFAAAAAMTGVEIPDKYAASITKSVTPAAITTAASVLQGEIAMKTGTMPGLNYNDLVQETGFNAVDVPDVTRSMLRDTAVPAATTFGILDNVEVDQAPAAAAVDDFADFEPMSLESFEANAPAAPDFSGVATPGAVRTEQQAVASLVDPHFSENVEVRPSEFGMSIDDRINNNLATVETNDYLAANFAGQTGLNLNDQALTTDAYENLAPTEKDFGTWGMGGANKFSDQFDGRAPTSTNPKDYSVDDANLGINPLGAAGMGEQFGVDLDRDYTDITSDLYGADPMRDFQAATPAQVDLSDVQVDARDEFSGFESFSAGTGMGTGQNPDFSAPSLEARNAMDRFDGSMAARTATAPDLQNEAIADRVNAQLGPQPAAGSITNAERASFEKSMEGYARERQAEVTAQETLAAQQEALSSAGKSFAPTASGIAPQAPDTGVPFGPDAFSTEVPSLNTVNSAFDLGTSWGPNNALSQLSRAAPDVTAPAQEKAPAAPAPAASKPSAPAPAPQAAPMTSYASAPTPKAQEAVKSLAAAEITGPSARSASASPYAGYATAQDAMSAIGAGQIAGPASVSDWDKQTAFSESPYAGAAYSAVMDAVAKEGGLAARKDIDVGFLEDTGMSPETARTVSDGIRGAAKGLATGGITGAAVGGLMGATGWGKKVDDYVEGLVEKGWNSITGKPSTGATTGKKTGQTTNPDGSVSWTGADGVSHTQSAGYTGDGRAGETYSNSRGFSDPGGWGLGNLGDLSGFADGSAYGNGGNGGPSQGGMNSNGGYGNDDGSVSNNGPGIW